MPHNDRGSDRDQPALADLRAQAETLRNADWTHDVRGGDPRFSSLPLPHGRSIADQASALLSLEQTSERQLAELLTHAESAHSLHRTISQQSFEQQLTGLAHAASGESDNRLEALLTRLGWFAHEPETLQDAGAAIGVTRERMRQIQEKMLKRIPDQIWLPRLDDALALLKQAAPLRADDESALLPDAGVAERPLPPVAIDRATRAIRGQSPFDAKLLRRGIIYVGALPVPYEDIITIACKRARSSGFSTLTMLCAELVEAGAAIPVGVLRILVESSDQLEMLDDSAFWEPGISPGRNRLENTLIRMLTVTSPLSLDSLLGGLNREYRYRNASRHNFDIIRVPDRGALIAYVRTHDGFHLSGDEVSLVTPRSAEAVLGPSEFILVDVLNNAPDGALLLNDAANACIERGMNRTTAYLYLRYLPTIEEPSKGLFAARGRITRDRDASK